MTKSRTADNKIIDHKHNLKSKQNTFYSGYCPSRLLNADTQTRTHARCCLNTTTHHPDPTTEKQKDKNKHPDFITMLLLSKALPSCQTTNAPSTIQTARAHLRPATSTTLLKKSTS